MLKASLFISVLLNAILLLLLLNKNNNYLLNRTEPINNTKTVNLLNEDEIKILAQKLNELLAEKTHKMTEKEKKNYCLTIKIILNNLKKTHKFA